MGIRADRELAVSIERGDASGSAWEYARRPVHPALAGVVVDHTGYVEQTREPVRRREVPHGGVVLILNVGEPLHVGSPPTRTHTTRPATGARPAGASLTPRRSFVAGLHDRCVVTEHHGSQRGVQVNLTPLGAYRLLGAPMAELANDVVDLDDLRLHGAAELTDRLASASSWDACFSIVDCALMRWGGDGPQPDRAVAWAWDQLRRSHGRVAVSLLADEIGWSGRHFASRFRAQVGMAPKSASRILRFDHAVTLLGRDDRSIGDVAAAAGYADHSHMVREFRSLAGTTPSELLDAQHADGMGVAAPSDPA